MMVRRFKYWLTGWLCLLALAVTGAVQIDFYFEPGCGECDKVKILVLPQLEERFAGRYAVISHDIGREESFLKLLAAQEKFQVTENVPVSMVVGDRVFLGGFDEIDRRLLSEVELALAKPLDDSVTTAGEQPDILRERASRFTLGAIVLAGLVDGVNPCVFATLVFFLSLLSVSRITGRQLLLVGGSYCLACFLAYLALGFGLFRFLKLFAGYSLLQSIIEYGMVGILLLFAGLSLGDAVRYRRSRSSRDVILQLPDVLKQKIHAVMRRGLKARYLVPGAFLIGILVTALESVCTGQVYVPVLVLLTKETGPGRWFWYLLLYNLMYILPLLVLFAAYYGGIDRPGLLAWSRKNVVWGKAALGGLFILLAVLMIWL